MRRQLLQCGLSVLLVLWRGFLLSSLERLHCPFKDNDLPLDLGQGVGYLGIGPGLRLGRNGCEVCFHVRCPFFLEVGARWKDACCENIGG